LHRVRSIDTYRDEHVVRMLRVVRAALHYALQWADVFCQRADHLPLDKRPRLSLGVSGVLKLLSAAAAHGQLELTNDRARLAAFVDGSDAAHARGGAFLVCTHRDARDVRCAPIGVLQSVAARDWPCMCALAAVAREILSYNNHRPLSRTTTLLESEQQLVTFSNDDAFCRVLHDRIAECVWTTVTVQDDESEPPRRLSEVVANDYPSERLFDFGDSEFATPRKFANLLSYNWRIAHRDVGIYSLLGQSEPADEHRGLLVCMKTDTADVARMSWRGLFAMPNLALGTDPGIAPAFEIPRSQAVS
jgi:hypothetical protein